MHVYHLCYNDSLYSGYLLPREFLELHNMPGWLRLSVDNRCAKVSVCTGHILLRWANRMY